MEYFATNPSVAKDSSGKLVFSWTRVPYKNMFYAVELSNHDRIWNAYDEPLDASSVIYTGPTLTPGTYHYSVVLRERF